MKEGEVIEVKGSAAKPYQVKLIAGIVSCSCPAWRNQSKAINNRTCKHIKKVLGEAAPMIVPEKQKETFLPATEVMLAHPWDGVQDPTGWWMSEKLDGVRAYWDGENFWSRLGNKFFVPDEFKKNLPEDIHLDGELWGGRGYFQETVGTVKRQDYSGDWNKIVYVVFDCPSYEQEHFEWRQNHLKYLFELHTSKHWKVLKQKECKNLKDLKEFLAKVEAKGGEGIMLREPNSFYEKGRSHTLLKVKNFYDEEGFVVGHEPGKGKHKGRLGKLVVRRPDGIEFGVGTGFSDKERESPPSIGSKITYRYQELTDGGVPRFPSFVSARDYE